MVKTFLLDSLSMTWSICGLSANSFSSASLISLKACLFKADVEDAAPRDPATLCPLNIDLGLYV